MPGKPGWCAVTCGGVSENLNTVAEKVCSGNAAHAIDSKRIMIHTTAFVVWCYERLQSVLAISWNIQFCSRSVGRGR